ncbi:ankyrin repeat domain-containing protein 50, variant 3 [Coprinopsis cinerea AmutBmut pab1-1]|nr:ankyrin repeat domain-containing protein 50, variant 3 [Coprinopsis cinerea AmutBmut pab1-1]
MGQLLSTSVTSGQGGWTMPGTLDDFENEDHSMFKHARHVNIDGGIFITGDVIVQIDEYKSSNSLEKRRELVAQLRHWLADNVNFRAIHTDVRRRRTSGTGQWLLESRLYREWKKSKGGVIWWMGMPGAGKTVMASTIIDDLLPLENDSERTCVLFVYSRYTEPLAVTDILKALIKQCIERNHDLAALVKPVYDKHKLEETEPSADELVELLRKLESYFGRVYYVIDGVDEAHLDVRFDLIQVINNLQGNIMLTSRPLDDLGKDLNYAVFCKLAAQNDDLKLHMEEKLRRHKHLHRVLSLNNSQEEVLHQIIEKAEGMFLHASLQLDAIQHCRSLECVKKKLAEFPTGLHGVYAATMQRIEEQDPESRDLAKWVLLWLTYARGPLSMQDLRYALATRDTGAYEHERMPDEASVISVCCGLVEEHWASNTIRLIHYTAIDAIAPLLLKDFPHPHVPIAKTLFQRITSTATVPTYAILMPFKWDEQPLLFYAHKHLGVHVHQCPQSEITDAIDHFLSSFTHIPFRWGWNRDLDWLGPPHVAAYYGFWPHFQALRERGWDLNLKTTKKRNTPLHFAAILGERRGVEALLQCCVDINVKCADGWTPLMHGAGNGHKDVVELLLVPGVAVNTIGAGGTALELASLKGHEGVVDRLLQFPGILVDATGSGYERIAHDPGSVGDIYVKYRAEASRILAARAGLKANFPQAPKVDTEESQGQTALMAASSRGHVGVVNRLLQVPGISDYASCALLLALDGGHEGAVGRLLQVPGIDVNCTTRDGITALTIASIIGNERNVEMLLQCQGINVNARSPDGSTALMLASRFGREGVVSRLLQVPGVDVNAAQSEGWTALMLASYHGHEDIVSRLLRVPTIEVNSTKNDELGLPKPESKPKINRYRYPARFAPKLNGWTPLILASERGHEGVVSAILQHPRVKVNATRKDGWTALMVASDSGHSGIVSRLLQAPGVDFNARNTEDGSTALMLALQNNRCGVVIDRLLQVPELDVNAARNDGWTALMIASKRGHWNVVVKLLQVPGIDVNAVSKAAGITALDLACIEDRTDIVCALLEFPGIAVNAPDHGGWTALMLASLHGHDHTVAKLLQFPGIDVNAVQQDGWTALMAASINGHEGVVTALLRAPGIQVDIACTGGWTALMMASNSGYTGVVDRLLQIPGINVGAANSAGLNALMAASINGFESVVSRLLEDPGLDVNAAKNDGFTALMLASNNGHEKTVARLIQVPGIQVNNAEGGWGPLMLAASHGHADIVARLLNFPGIQVHPSHLNGCQWSALMLASVNGHEDTVARLLQFPGMQVNATNDGWTALMLASWHGHEGIVARLLQDPAIEVNMACQSGQTALMLAARNGHIGALKQLLLHPKLDPHLRDRHNFTALHWAAESGHHDTVRELVECDGVDVNAVDDDGETALIMASRGGHTLVVEALLKVNGLDVDAKANNGFTAAAWLSWNRTGLGGKWW